MAEVVDVLKAGKVIGDVVDSFTPVVELRVQYGSTTVSNGCEIKPLEAQNRPHLQVATEKPHRDNLYTLFMVDPDAPDPSKPVLKEWLHWLVVDIPEGMDASKGRTMVEYMGPQPPTGKHRYVFVLYKQKGPLVKPKPLPPSYARGNFNTRHFVAHNDLLQPAAALYFQAQKEANVAYDI